MYETIIKWSYLKMKMFSDSEHRNEEVILLDVARNTRQSVRIDFFTIQVPLTGYFEFTRISKSEAVEEGRFASSTSSHNGKKFTGTYDSGDLR